MTNKSSQKDDQWDRIAEGIFNAIFQLSKIFITGVGDFFRWIRCHYFEFLAMAGAINFLLVQVHWHLELIYSILPNTFGLKVIRLIAGASSSDHFLRLMLLEVLCLCFILGIKVISTRKKWENFFEATGLKNGKGTYPSFIKSVSLDNYRTHISLLVMVLVLINSRQRIHHLRQCLELKLNQLNMERLLRL